MQGRFEIAFAGARGYNNRDASRAADISIQPVSLAAGRLHQPAFSPHRARVGRRRPGHDRPGQRPLAPGKEVQGPQADRDFPRRLPARRPIVRLGARRDARCGGLSRIAGHRLRRHQHGLPGAQSLPRRRRFGDDDGVGQDRQSRQGHGGGGEDSHHRQDAPRLGRREHHRPRPGARARRRRRGGHLRSWPHARAGILRHGQPGRHPRGGGGAEASARHRQRRCHHTRRPRK